MDSNGSSVQDAELIGQALGRCARRVVAGVPVDVAGDGDGGVPEQVGYRLDVDPSLSHRRSAVLAECGLGVVGGALEGRLRRFGRA